MQRYLMPALAAVVLTACRDSARPTGPDADPLTASAYQPIPLWLPGDLTEGFAVAMNNRTQAIAYGTTGKDGRFESAQAFLWDDGDIQDLGTLGGSYTVPTDINDRGQVVGWSSASWLTDAHAFFWDDGTMQDLGPVVVYGAAQPVFNQIRINNRGQVLGNRPGAQAFLWKNGVTQTVPLDFAAALNDRGQVAGWVWHDSAGVRWRRAAVWEDGVVTELGTLGGDESWAQDISNSGWVVGGSRTAPNELGSPELRAFRWRDGRLEDLGRSGQTSSGRPDGWQAHLVNGPGQVGARSSDLPFFWDQGVTQSINCRCVGWYPMDMNRDGGIVGWGGWVWKDGVLHVLEAGVPSRAIAINDGGAVAGQLLNYATIWLPVRH